jgi:hypothetical protein
VSLEANRTGKKPGALLTIAAACLLFLTSSGVSHAGDSGADNLSQSGVFLSGNGFACFLKCNGGNCDSNTCQAEFGAIGTIYGSEIVPPPASNPIWGVDCTTTQCSGGVRHNNTAKNILYGNYPTLCRFVDNTSTHNLFVPQASQTEFTDFINNAPGGVGFGYCTLGVNYPYTAIASYPDGFYITTDGGPAEPQPLAPGEEFDTNFPLPTTRVTNPLSPSPPEPVTLPAYTRYDCAPGTSPPSPSCRARTIVETQNIQVSMVANPSPACTNPAVGSMTNCNGSWTNGNVISVSCTVDGVFYAPGTPGCLDGYLPAPINGACGGLSNPSCTPGSCSGTCTAGILAGSSDNGTLTTWTCDGEYGGSNAPCSASDPGSLVNGVCGGLSNPSCTPGSCTGSCTAGTVTDSSDNGTTTSWVCDGSGGGSNSGPCSASDPGSLVNGVCGIRAGTCDAGTPTLATETYPSTSGAACGYIKPAFECCMPPHLGCFMVPGLSIYYATFAWTCVGSGGGSNANCNLSSVPEIGAPECGSCPSGFNTSGGALIPCPLGGPGSQIILYTCN